MSFIAIVGAGPVGGALAYRLAARDRVQEIRLIDAEQGVAKGKALDILQCSPIDGFTTRVVEGQGIEAAAGAQVVVLADAAAGGDELSGEGGLALLKRLTAMELDAPLVFASASHRELMARVVSELHVPPRRLLGSAPMALESAIRALTALEVNGTGTAVQVLVVGVPPQAAVIAWEEGTVFGQPVTAVVAPHRLLAISAQMPGLWPPGPQALASAAARVVEAVASGSRRRFTCFVPLDQAPVRGGVVALPVELGRHGVVRVLKPVLSRLEQTLLDNGGTDRRATV